MLNIFIVVLLIFGLGSCLFGMVGTPLKPSPADAQAALDKPPKKRRLITTTNFIYRLANQSNLEGSMTLSLFLLDFSLGAGGYSAGLGVLDRVSKKLTDSDILLLWSSSVANESWAKWGCVICVPCVK